MLNKFLVDNEIKLFKLRCVLEVGQEEELDDEETKGLINGAVVTKRLDDEAFETELVDNDAFDVCKAFLD